MTATERDRERADELAIDLPGIDYDDDGISWRRQVDAIAEALAAERDRAREPFLRLLVQLDAYKDRRDLLSERDTQAVAWLAEHVRAAAEEST